MDFPLLCKIFRLSNSQLLNIRESFDNLQTFLEAPLSDIQPFVTSASYKAIRAWRNSGKLPTAYTQHKDFLQQESVKTLSLDSDHYPELLAQISAPPAILFVKGSMEKLALPQIAIVGSRRSTAQGIRLAHEFSEQLARAGFAITSGLALGIDGAAHRGAIAANATTLAVMGTGIDQIYPARHRALADEILISGGALMTEFMPGSSPRPQHFPQRNRIVTGLSLGVLVIEASERSGSLISARLAAEQGRAVCAVPGSIRSPVSEGCNQLIREGAILVTNAEQVVEQLGSLLGFQKETCIEKTQTDQRKPEETPCDEHWLLGAMGFDPCTVDDLCDLSGRATAEITAELAELELQGKVVQAHYGYQRIT